MQPYVVVTPSQLTTAAASSAAAALPIFTITDDTQKMVRFSTGYDHDVVVQVGPPGGGGVSVVYLASGAAPLLLGLGANNVKWESGFKAGNIVSVWYPGTAPTSGQLVVDCRM